MAPRSTETDRSAVPTLEQLMGHHKNDWTKEDEIFYKITKRHLDDTEELERDICWNLLRAWDVGRRISIVIPTEIGRKTEHLKLTLRALDYQTFLRYGPRRSDLEIIIVNDGPVTPAKVFEIAHFSPRRARLIVFSLADPQGPALARNVGLFHSTGDIVFFVDSDMLLEPRLIAEHVIRHEYLPNLALTTFRWDIDLKIANKLLDKAKDKDDLVLETDWKRDWKGRNLKIDDDSSQLNGKRYYKGANICLYKATRGFKKWEGAVNKRVLPSVFVGNCVSVRREHLIAVGGFRSHYSGWGIEDRDLGARLMARGVRLVPVRTACTRHIKHKEKKRYEKYHDLEENIARYNSLISVPYQENPANLIKQIEGLEESGTLLPALEFDRGIPMPREHPSAPPTACEAGFEALLRLADTHLRRLISFCYRIHFVPDPPRMRKCEI